MIGSANLKATVFQIELRSIAHRILRAHRIIVQSLHLVIPHRPVKVLPSKDQDAIDISRPLSRRVRLFRIDYALRPDICHTGNRPDPLYKLLIQGICPQDMIQIVLGVCLVLQPELQLQLKLPMPHFRPRHVLCVHVSQPVCEHDEEHAGEPHRQDC